MKVAAKNRLSAGFIRTAPVGKHCDGGGLWLIKREDGGAQWMLRVTVHGRRREMGLGGFPSLGLADARKLSERWRSHGRSWVVIRSKSARLRSVLRVAKISR